MAVEDFMKPERVVIGTSNPKTKNVLDELDVAFIEGAIASPEHVKKIKEIRRRIADC